MEEIQVSVICTAFNQEKYIRSALDGFVMQKTNFPFEVIVHDDASTDGTAEIIREYEEKYPELFVAIYETKNQYSKHDGTIKRILREKIRGKYVALCEGDDYWISPDKLQRQMDFLEAHPDYSLCACSAQRLNMLNGKLNNQYVTTEDRDVSLEENILWEHGRIFTTVSVMLKTELYKSIPNWGLPIGDYPRDCYCAMNGKVHMLADVMCVYRWNAEGSWTQRMEKHRDDVSLKMIAGLENMDRDTGGKYHDLIHKKILIHQYTYAIITRDFKALKSGELGGMYKKRDFVHRMSDFARCKFPKLYGIIHRMTGRSA